MMRRIVLLALAVALSLAWLLMLRPVFLGGPASYIMVSGTSMHPTLQSGDLAVLRKQASYASPDVIAFRVEGAVVIARIVGGDAQEGFTVRGDNKNAPDPWRPTKDDILGRMWFRVPRAGLFLISLRQPLILGSLAGGLGMLTVLSGGSGKPEQRSGRRRTRPPSRARGSPPGTRLILGLVLAGALARGLGLFRKSRTGGTPG